MSTMPPYHPIPSAAGVSMMPEGRATFGWRPGSIRGLLSLMVLGLLWTVAVFSPEWTRDQQVPLVYIYLQYLIVLIVAYYFPPQGSIHPRSPQDRRRLRIWPEIVPWVLVLGTIGLGVWVYQRRLDIIFSPQASFMLPLVLLGSFFFGYLISLLVAKLNRGRLPYWFQDLEAWVALLGIVGLTAELLIYLFILQGLDPEQQQSLRGGLEQFEGILAGLVSFYFGARSETPRVSS